MNCDHSTVLSSNFFNCCKAVVVKQKLPKSEPRKPCLCWSPQSESNYDLILAMDALRPAKLRATVSSCTPAMLAYIDMLRFSAFAFLASLAYRTSALVHERIPWAMRSQATAKKAQRKTDTLQCVCFSLEPSIRVELMTSSLPWMRSAN